MAKKTKARVTGKRNIRQKSSVAVAINLVAKRVHRIARRKEWWAEERNDGELIALMHSELSAALEGLRKGNPSSEHIPEFSAFEEVASRTG